MTTFTDAEQRFADSPQGRAAIAYERNKFETRNGYLGERAPRWDDAMQADAIRTLTVQQARNSVRQTAFLADCERQLPVLRIQADVARQEMIDRTRNAYRGNQ